MKTEPILVLATTALFAALIACGTEPPPIEECESPPCDEEEECLEPPCEEEENPWEECEHDPDLWPGEPITAPVEQWTWVDVGGTRCMNDTATGLAVELAAQPEGTLIYLQGGGLCFDFGSCSQVANPNGFDADDFATMHGAGYMNIGIFNRTDPTNPFRNFNLVFIPYCSGDLFGGENESGFGGRVHAGLRNHELFLERLVPTFAEAGPIVLAGSSAGAYGASIQHHRTQLAFDCTPVHLLNDSGPVFSDTYTRPCFQTLLRNSFGLDAALPADCEQCFGADGGGLGELLPFLAERHPRSRFAVLTTTADQVIRYFMGYGYSASCASAMQMPASEFEAGVLELQDGVAASHENVAMFVKSGTDHVLVVARPSGTVTDGVSLAAWIFEMLDPDASWTSVGP